MLITKQRTNKDAKRYMGLFRADPTLSAIPINHALYKGYLKEYDGQSFNSYELFRLDGNGGNHKGDSFRAPKMVCETLASLNNAEELKVLFESSEKNQKFIDEIFEDNDFYTNLNLTIEKTYALGGGIIKFSQKQLGEENVKFDMEFIGAHRFIPTQWNSARVLGGVFISSKRDGEYYIWLFEEHVWETHTNKETGFQEQVYVIRNKTYKTKTPTFDEQASFVKLAYYYPELKDETMFVGIESPFFEYIKPNLANNIDLDSPAGISIYWNSLSTIKLLDRMITSFNKDFKYGQKIVLVPSSRIKSFEHRDKDTGKVVHTEKFLDVNQEIFQELDDNAEGNADIREITMEIRVEDHNRAIQSALDMISIQCGLSAGTFTWDNASGGIQTATQVISSKDKTWRTKMKHENNFSKGIKRLVKSMVQVGSISGFDVDYNEKAIEVIVKFDDSIIVDDDKNRELGLNINEKGIMSDYDLLTDPQYGFGFDEKKAKEWLARASEQAKEKMEQQQEAFGFNDKDPYPEPDPKDPVDD